MADKKDKEKKDVKEEGKDDKKAEGAEEPLEEGPKRCVLLIYQLYYAILTIYLNIDLSLTLVTLQQTIWCSSK